MSIHPSFDYRVQCLAGHVYRVTPGSELETRCEEHLASSFIDALILPHDECEYCLYDAILRARRNYQAICGDWGCMGDCGATDPDKCQGTDDIRKYEDLLAIAQKRNDPRAA